MVLLALKQNTQHNTTQHTNKRARQEVNIETVRMTWGGRTWAGFGQVTAGQHSYPYRKGCGVFNDKASRTLVLNPPQKRASSVAQCPSAAPRRQLLLTHPGLPFGGLRASSPYYLTGSRNMARGSGHWSHPETVFQMPDSHASSRTVWKKFT